MWATFFLLFSYFPLLSKDRKRQEKTGKGARKNAREKKQESRLQPARGVRVRGPAPLHVRCPTTPAPEPCCVLACPLPHTGLRLTMRAVLPRFTPQGGAAAKKGQAPPAGRSSHSRQHVWLGHSARTCPRSTSSTRRTATRRCRALWAMCSMSLSVQSASACAMRSIDLAHFTPPRRPGRASAPLGPPLSACSSDSPWLTRSDSVLGRRCATERTMTITS